MINKKTKQKTVFLIILKLENFKGISAEYNFSRNRNIFYGENGTGKTTLLDAEIWLREGENSAGKKRFPIQSVEKKSTESNFSVYGRYYIDNDYHEFKRSLVQKLDKENKIISKTMVYHYNHHKVTEKAYINKIQEVFSSCYRLCVEMTYFFTMHWKERRDLLFQLFGEGHQETIIESMPKLKKLAGSSDIHDHYEYCLDRLKETSSEIQTRHIQIEERKKVIEQTTDMISLKEAEKAVLKANETVNKVKIKIEKFKSDDKTETLEELKKLHSELFDLENQFSVDKLDAKQDEEERKNEIAGIDSLKKQCQETLIDYIAERDRLRDQWSVINNRKIDSHPCDHYSENCPYYSFDVPKEKQEKHNLELNRKKSIDLEFVIQKGRELNVEIENTEKLKSAYQLQLKELNAVEPPAILTTEESEEIAAKKSKIKELKQTHEKQNTVPEKLLNELKDAEKDQQNALMKKASFDTSKESRERVEELNQEIKNFTIENLKVSEYIDLYNQYVKKLSEAVEEPINNVFEKTKIKMFKFLENGRLKESCEITDKYDRNYNDMLSRGQKLEIELDCIKTFQNHFKISGPVMIDDINLFTKDIALECQTVELWAKRGVKTLTKETYDH